MDGVPRLREVDGGRRLPLTEVMISSRRPGLKPGREKELQNPSLKARVCINPRLWEYLYPFGPTGVGTCSNMDFDHKAELLSAFADKNPNTRGAQKP